MLALGNFCVELRTDAVATFCILYEYADELEVMKRIKEATKNRMLMKSSFCCDTIHWVQQDCFLGMQVVNLKKLIQVTKIFF